MRSLIGSLSVAAVLAGLVVAPAAAATKTDSAGTYVPVAPTRLLNGATLNSHVARDVQVGGRAGVPTTGVAAAAITINLSAPAPGALVAYASGSRQPRTATTQFNAGQRLAATSLVALGSNGAITLFQNASTPVHFSVDVTGYYLAGASSEVKSYHAVAPARVLNVTIPAHGSLQRALDGTGPLPGVGVGAIAATFSEFGARSSGYLTAGAPPSLNIPAEGVVRWTGSQRAGAFGVAPVDAAGTIYLANSSASAITVAVDVLGYYLQGAPSLAGTFNNVPAAHVLAPTSIPAGGSRSITLPGVAGVPLAGIRAAVLTIYGSSASNGSLVAYGSTSAPGTANVQFTAGRQTSDVAIVSVYPSGRVTFRNNASGPVSIGVDITGWILRDTITAPSPDVGRYVRNLKSDDNSYNTNVMGQEGVADAGSAFVLLDIGAQLNNKSGVELSNTSIQLTYGDLVTALQAYVDGYANAGGAGKIAVGTNNDAADWTSYPASARGKDWATKVVNAIDPPAGVTVVGASDMEPGFGTTRESDAAGWKSAYLANATDSTRQFVFNGSADGCSTSFQRPATTCSYGWTEQQLYDLAGGPNTLALPQIYNSRMAIQWTNIDQTGRRSGDRGLVYEGALTENFVDGSYPADQGWAALYSGESTLVTTPTVPAVVQLTIDS